MSSLQQRIAAVTHATANLIAQLRELDRLRERVSKAKLSALRVCPETSGRIAEFSEHEAD